MIQEPCCIERTLPLAVKKYGWLPWQSNGDITIEKILKAVSYLAGNALDISICLPAIDIPALRLFAWYFKRGWLKSLTIITPDDQSELIRAELPAELKLTVTNHASVNETSPILFIQGEIQTVIVQGPLHTSIATTPTRENYITYAGKDQDRISQFTDTLSALIRVASKKKPKKGSATMPDASPAVSDATADSVPADPPSEDKGSQTAISIAPTKHSSNDSIPSPLPSPPCNAWRKADC